MPKKQGVYNSPNSPFNPCMTISVQEMAQDYMFDQWSPLVYYLYGLLHNEPYYLRVCWNLQYNILIHWPLGDLELSLQTHFTTWYI